MSDKKTKLIEFLKRKTGWTELMERPMTKEDEIYEESRKRLYEIHLQEEDLFYAEDSGLYDEEPGGRGFISGEIAKGNFEEKDLVVLLNNQGLPVMEAQVEEILTEEQVPRGLFRRSEKYTLVISGLEPSDQRERIYETFLVKKKSANKLV